MKFVYDRHSTPVDPNESHNLIPSNIFTQDELNTFEQANISRAEEKLFKGKNILFSVEFIGKVHKEMFCDTWQWAGKFRTFNTNIGIEYVRIRQELFVLCDDVNFQINSNVFSLEETAIRFSHRLVSVHPFPNGNGRCSRLLADLLLFKKGMPKFTWGSMVLTNMSEVRNCYIEALREADNHNIVPLLKFARS
jgi:Fic-DOC domain mobile mystery protein B